MPDKQPHHHHNPLTLAEKKVLVAGNIVGTLLVGIANHAAFGETGTCSLVSTLIFSSLLLGTPTRTEGSIAGDLALDVQNARDAFGERIQCAVSFVVSHLDRRSG